jgi:hypothetical protein
VTVDPGSTLDPISIATPVEFQQLATEQRDETTTPTSPHMMDTGGPKQPAFEPEYSPYTREAWGLSMDGSNSGYPMRGGRKPKTFASRGGHLNMTEGPKSTVVDLQGGTNWTMHTDRCEEWPKRRASKVRGEGK